MDPVLLPGWTSSLGEASASYHRDLGIGRRVLVGCFDGQSWGWLIRDDRGVLLDGRLGDGVTRDDALTEAETTIGEQSPLTRTHPLP